MKFNKKIEEYLKDIDWLKLDEDEIMMTINYIMDRYTGKEKILKDEDKDKFTYKIYTEKEIQYLENELKELLKLYLYLHEESVPEMTEHLRDTWTAIMQDENHHIIVKEADGKIVSSCVCVIIPNLTRNIRPYAFVENVVTHGDYRGNGYATECLNYAKRIAEKANCYKIMLLTGSKEEDTLNFYMTAGYNNSDKTAFIQWL